MRGSTKTMIQATYMKKTLKTKTMYNSDKGNLLGEGHINLKTAYK